jgi:catechol 2,3-dioxygenase-like lactoylglutathione lyase family enzyme
MLDSCAVMTFAGTRDAARALAFYRDRLGLRFVSDDSFALVFDAHGTMLRVTRVGPFTPLPFTALGWAVGDIHEQVRELAARGVEFERFAHVPADELGVWAAPDGTKVAWFKDPDGNTLSLTEFAR